MPNWKKVIISGSRAPLSDISASNLPNGTGTENLIAYDATSKGFVQISQGNLSGLADADWHIKNGTIVTSSLDVQTSGSLTVFGTGSFASGGIILEPHPTAELFIGGNITASGDISASGLLFLSASDAAGSEYLTVLIDTGSGRLYYTGSYGGGGGGDSEGGSGNGFPFTGKAEITGSLEIFSGSLTAMQTGSINGLNYVPIIEGGTYTPPTYPAPTIINKQMGFRFWGQFGGTNYQQSHTVDLGNNFTGNVTLKNMSMSGDFEGNSEYVQNVVIGGQTIINSWGGNISGTPLNINTEYVPVFDNDADVTTNANYPSGLQFENFGGGDATQISAVNGIIDITLQITPAIGNTGGGPNSGNPTFALVFEFSDPDAELVGGTFGKGVLTGDATQTIDAAHFINVPTGSFTPASGIRITLGTEAGATTGFGASNGQFINCYSTDGTQSDIIKVGTAYAGFNGVEWQWTSDKRLKENIVLSNQGLDIINNLKVKEFNFKNDKSKTPLVGFIAQELYEVIPQAVYKGGNDPKLDPWAIQPKALIPYLVNALQQQQKQIEDLQTQIDQLKTNTK